MFGKYFDEFEIGMIFEYQFVCMVIEIDNFLFLMLMFNLQLLYIDVEFVKEQNFGQILVNSIFIFGFVIGVLVKDMMLGMMVGNFGFEKIEFFNFVFIGDMICVMIEVVVKCELKLRLEWGIVIFEYFGFNQCDEIVCCCVCVGMMFKVLSL